MIQLLTKTIVATTVPLIISEAPKIIEQGWNALISWAGLEEPATVPMKKHVRKKHDTTKFTQYMHTYINKEHDLWVRTNADRKNDTKIPMENLIDSLNTVLELDKGRTSFSNIWNGKINVETLITGKPIKGFRTWND